jgi:hypothetical protein
VGAIRTINDRWTRRSDQRTDPPSTRRRLPGISRLLAVAALAGLSVPAVFGLSAPAATAATSTSLTATFQKTSDWGTGYIANYNIVNGGAPTSRWTLTFQLPSTETVTSSWSGNLSHVGTTYTVTNASWNGALATGGTATFGFQTTYTGGFVAPTQCTLNGQPCSGPTGGTGSGTLPGHRHVRQDL